MTSIPTDEQIDAGINPFLTDEDTRPVDVEALRRNGTDLGDVRTWARRQGYEVSDRGRVSKDIREAYERAGGRPTGTSSSTSRGRRNQPPTPEEVAERRRERIRQYSDQIIQDVNPFMLDLGCMFSGVDKKECLRIDGTGDNQRIYYTPKGEQLIFNGTQIRLFATTAARLQETERGQQIIDTFNATAPWMFLVLSAGALLMWLMNVFMMRQIEMQRKRMENGFQPGTPSGAPNMMDMLGSFMGKRKQRDQTPKDAPETLIPDATAGVDGADAEPLIATDGLK